MKNFCPTHHFMYNGIVCPFCDSERINGLAHKFVVKESTEKATVDVKKEKEREVTTEDLKKLAEKFNKKR